MKNYKIEYQNWVKNIDKKYLPIVKDMDDEKQKFFFSSNIQFGTAGIREKIALGTNSINEYTIAKFAFCFGKALIERNENIKKGVVVFHDNRLHGREFALKAAKILSALNIKTYLFHNNDASTTPLLSYTIIKKNYIGGINITASHNTKEYSGMKFYDSYGKQIYDNFIKIFSQIIDQKDDYFNFKEDDKNINYLSLNIINEYIDDTVGKNKQKFLDKKNFKVIYNSNHGAGISIMKPILEKLNYDYTIVKEQEEIDPEFTNSPIPNPQYENSFFYSKKYGNKLNADILIGSDPDADRIGVMVKKDEKWVLLNGNQIPIIQVHYLINKLLKEGTKDFSKYFVVKSIVTSNYANIILDKYKIKHYSTLTGFSWIANKTKEIIVENPSLKPLIIWEESNGSILNYLIVRDKDFFQNAINILEIAYELKEKHNKTLLDYLDDIQEEYGYFDSSLETLELNSNNLYNKLSEKINNLVKENIFENFEIEKIIDYKLGYKDIPKKDVIEVLFKNKSTIFLRNSGTEPILKIYINLENKDKNLLEKHKMVVNNFLKKLF